MEFVWLILFGLVVGVLAKLLMPGRDPGGIMITTLLGVAGAVLGGYLGQAFAASDASQGASLLTALVGAVLLLAIYRLAFRRRAV